MHTVRFLLKTSNTDERIIEKRFHAISHIHNVLVKHAKKLIKKLENDREYQLLHDEYAVLLKKDRLTKEENARRKEISKEMADIRIKMGLSEYSFQSYIKVCAGQFRKCLSSQQIQKEATRVWKSVSDYLFGKGKAVHFKKFRDFDTIGGKSNTNGVKFDKDTLSVSWIGLHIKCKLPCRDKDRRYILDSLADEISYCEIKRLMFPNGWHYYVIVYLKGDAPKKLNPDKKRGTMGVDIGTSTVAAVSEDMVMLKELAPMCQKYNTQIEALYIKMDASKRAVNPGKYNSDGTINRANKDKWVYSKTYCRYRDRLKSLYRQKSEYIKQSHERMCNILIGNSKYFIAEAMTFKGLQKRAKKTERSLTKSTIKVKDGSFKQIYKYRKKKRFGRSLNNRAPAKFITILERKAEQYGGKLYKVNTKSFKASQYDHISDTYRKVSLSSRSKTVGGQYVQRDLYSAYLLKNSKDTLECADREKCIEGFESFIGMQNEMIEKMKTEGISNRACFGF